MYVIFNAVGMLTNEYIASLATYPSNSKSVSITDLILLQEALSTYNIMIQKSQFLKM